MINLNVMDKEAHYEYFISYAYTTNEGFGFGNTSYSSRKNITDIDDIRKVEKVLLDKIPNPTSITILSYRLLDYNSNFVD